MKLKVEKKNIIEVSDWDKFIEHVYGRPYSFQQQNGCQERGVFPLRVPVPQPPADYERDSIPEEINGDEMGVSFEAWKSRDPKAPVGEDKEERKIVLFWHRNFYPDIDMIANDLHERGLLEAGEYLINIDW
jgi:hypothetical protein